jgi:hypothetical protein
MRGLMVILVVAPGIAAAEPSPFEAALRVGGQQTELHWMCNAPTELSPRGPLFDGEAGYRGKWWSVAGFLAYSQVHTSGYVSDSIDEIVTFVVKNRFTDLGLRARVEYAGLFAGVGIGIEQLGESGTYITTRQLPGMPGQPMPSSASDSYSATLYELHFGYTAPRIEQCNCAVQGVLSFTTASSSYGVSASSTRLALGVQF